MFTFFQLFVYIITGQQQDPNKVETKISTSSRPPSSPAATNQFVTGLSTILRRTSFRIEDSLVTTEASTSISTTKRKPKTFFTSSTTSKNPFGSYQDQDGGSRQQPQLVDGFDVGGGGGDDTEVGAGDAGNHGGDGGNHGGDGGNHGGDAGNHGGDGGDRGGRGDLVDGTNTGSSGGDSGGGGNNRENGGPNVGTKNDSSRPSRVLQTNQGPTTSSSVLKDQGGSVIFPNNGDSEVQNSGPVEVAVRGF